MSWGGFNLPPGFENMDDFSKAMIWQSVFNDRRRQQEKEDLPEMLRQISKIQFENAQASQRLGLEANIAGGALKSLYDMPGQILRAGQMYGPETATNFARTYQAPQATIRPYFG
jgi:hypothetical protein